MSSSSFPYNWDNVIHVINKIYSIINFRESKCGIYNMDYISQSPIHCSKVNIERVIKCTKFPGRQANGFMLDTNCSSIEYQYNKLGDSFNNKKRKNKYTCSMFYNEFLAASKQLNFVPEILIFQWKRRIYMWLQFPVFYV